MSETEPDPPVGDQLFQEAATWFARMRGPDAEESRQEFEAWLARGALHRAAYNRASEIFAMGKLLEEPGEPLKAPAPKRRPLGLFVLIGAVMFLFIFGFSWLNKHVEGSSLDTSVATTEGPRRGSAMLAATSNDQTIRLIDGSLVRLGAGTKLGMNFDGKYRGLTLEEGRARFEVAHELRPFVVQAGGGSVTARGTVFDVEVVAHEKVVVRLIQGVVDVALPSSHAAGKQSEPRQLRPGQSISFAAAQPQSNQSMARQLPGAVTANGASDFDEVRLSELVALANRKTRRPIRLAPPALGQRQLSGRFRVDDTELLAERLAALFDLNIDRGNGVIVLTPK